MAPRSETVWVDRGQPGRPDNAVHFRTAWWLDAGEAEVLAILNDYDAFSDWWGATFLDVEVLRRVPPGTPGLRGRVHSKGFLPYTFRWTAEVVTSGPDHLTLSAVGDFCGTGTFRRPRPGEPGDLMFDWEVAIEEPMLKAFCPWLRPLYRWNHAYAMRVGARSLQAEVARRRGAVGAAAEACGVP